VRKSKSTRVLTNRKWKKEENNLRNKMYEVKQNAVPKIEVREKEN
jgi:hypothetical protein